MFSLFRGKKPPASLTFNDRVTAFWRWFQSVAPRFYATIESGQCSSLGDETSAKLNELLPGFAWVYGPGENNRGHSLTLSGEGNEHLQLLTVYWCAQAPKIEGWTFYPSRQAGPIKGHVVSMLGHRFDPKEIWITPDVQNERVNLKVWHPLLDQIEQNKRFTIMFIFLDEVLGEYGTQWWIGKIDFGRDRLAESFPLEELADYIQRLSAEHGWEKFSPGEAWSVFSVEEPREGFPRSDIITQTTAAPVLFRDYMEAEGELEDPLRGTGADYIFVSIVRRYFPSGEETEIRGKVEEALDAALRSANAGRCLGGALGLEKGYVDLLIYDGAASLTIIQKTLRGFNLPRGAMIEFFAREKRGQRVALA